MTAVINYDQPVKNLIDALTRTGHVSPGSYRKTSVTLHHNAGRLSHEGCLNVWKTRPASAHFDVDRSGAVCQYVKVNGYAWACASRTGNQSSISIEMASPVNCFETEPGSRIESGEIRTSCSRSSRPTIVRTGSAAESTGAAGTEGFCAAPGTAPPPAAEFVLAAGDSAFWVTSAGGTVRVRGAPLELARVDGRFYELYVADDDRSFEDATFIGQRVYRRDLLRGDSVLVYEDSLVPRLAGEYARAHPEDRPLAANDQSSDDPLWSGIATLDLVDLHGPFVSFDAAADPGADGDVDLVSEADHSSCTCPTTWRTPASRATGCTARWIAGRSAPAARSPTRSSRSSITNASTSRSPRSRSTCSTRSWPLRTAGSTATSGGG